MSRIKMYDKCRKCKVSVYNWGKCVGATCREAVNNCENYKEIEGENGVEIREIKFRAWDKELKRMCRVIQIDFTNRKIIVFHESEDERSNWLDLDRFILMQYTGLKDKNGTEIYEGDILKRIRSDYGDGETHKEYGIVEYDAPGFTLDRYIKLNENIEIDYVEGYWELFEFGELEIIGNKCDNPELLEV